jgi:hypothetical protein
MRTRPGRGALEGPAWGKSGRTHLTAPVCTDGALSTFTLDGSIPEALEQEGGSYVAVRCAACTTADLRVFGKSAQGVVAL